MLANAIGSANLELMYKVSGGCGNSTQEEPNAQASGLTVKDIASSIGLGAMKRRDRKGICALLTAAVIGVALAFPAYAQDNNQHPSHIPTPQQPNGPFGNQWAKPPGPTGSYIYNDPRLRDPNRSRPTRRNRRCPAPLLFDPTSGECR